MATLIKIWHFITNYKVVFLIDGILIGIVAFIAIFGLIDKYDILVQWCIGLAIGFITLLLLRILVTFIVYKLYGESE